LQQANMTGSHTSASGVARVADDAGVRRLAVTSIPQINDHADTLERLAGAIRDRFAGEVIIGRDLMTLEV
jgi:ribonuclease BN (tRNA processing enzyme)